MAPAAVSSVPHARHDGHQVTMTKQGILIYNGSVGNFHKWGFHVVANARRAEHRGALTHGDLGWIARRRIHSYARGRGRELGRSSRYHDLNLSHEGNVFTHDIRSRGALSGITACRQDSYLASTARAWSSMHQGAGYVGTSFNSSARPSLYPKVIGQICCWASGVSVEERESWHKPRPATPGTSIGSQTP